MIYVIYNEKLSQFETHVVITESFFFMFIHHLYANSVNTDIYYCVIQTLIQAVCEFSKHTLKAKKNIILECCVYEARELWRKSIEESWFWSIDLVTIAVRRSIPQETTCSRTASWVTFDFVTNINIYI